jgi:hypothetical protein
VQVRLSRGRFGHQSWNSSIVVRRLFRRDNRLRAPERPALATIATARDRDGERVSRPSFANGPPLGRRRYALCAIAGREAVPRLSTPLGGRNNLRTTMNSPNFRLSERSERPDGEPIVDPGRSCDPVFRSRRRNSRRQRRGGSKTVVKPRFQAVAGVGALRGPP